MGMLRLLLALTVISGHSESTVFGFHGDGLYAVNFFFIISGFYMAMVLNEKYKDVNPIHFYKSRVFRLFPVYYVGILLSLLISFRANVDFFNHLSIGTQFFFIFQNLFILGQDLSYLLCPNTVTNECAAPWALTINQPAWSLATELGFYLVAPFVLKSVKKTFFYFLVGCIYFVSLNGIVFSGEDLGFLRRTDYNSLHYFFYASSFIFFGGGALAYHLSKNKANLHYVGYVAILCTLILLSFSQTIMPFGHLFFVGLAIPVLFSYTAKNRIDRAIGELSYPVYILHFPLLVFFRPLMPTISSKFSFMSLGTIVAVLSCTLGLLLYQFLEKKVNNYRASQDFFHDTIIKKPYIQAITVNVLLLVYVLFIPMSVVAYLYYDQKFNTHIHHNTANSTTDGNWVNGVGRNIVAFFVNGTTDNLERYKVGRKVKFINGDVREIIRVLKAGPYINIFLDGPLLNGEQVGFPNEIEIIK